MSDIQVQIVKGNLPEKLILDFHESADSVSCVGVTGGGSNGPARKYALVWYRNDYRNIALDSILWVRACGSDSSIHLEGNEEMVVSSNLSMVGKSLPDSEFARIHRSCIVNLGHVRQLVGNSLDVDGTLLPIGREYRESVFNRFVFLGTRRNKK